MKILGKIGLGLLLLIVVLLVVIVVVFRNDASIPYDVSTEGVEVPQFTTVEIPWVQEHDNSTTLPFMASAVIDVDGDGTEELFLGGGRSQADVLLAFGGGRFAEVSGAGFTKKPGEATHGATVLDVDKDGDDDLIVARTDGLWLHLNNGGTFSNTKLDATMPEGTTPMGIGLGDINRDGHFDMFVGGYIRKDLVAGQTIFNGENYGGASQLFINNGDNSFTNMTESAGLTYIKNTFMGVFVDADEDGFEDLVVAHDTGQVRTWRNNGDGTFTNKPNPSSGFNGYPMGIAVGDYNNDGLVDFFFSNVGSTTPDFMVRGDTTADQQTNWKWYLFKNDGGFEFSEAADTAKVADYEFSWGAIFEDFNLDGREDLVVSENYIAFPFHTVEFLRLPGRFLIQNTQGEFAAVGAQAGVVNTRFSIAPLTADFNGDGRPDLVHANLAGKSLAFISQPGSGQSLKVRLANQIESVGAKVTVSLSDGTTQSKWFVRGEGLSSDSSPVLIFGLGEAQAESVTVKYLNGRQEIATDGLASGLIVFSN